MQPMIAGQPRGYLWLRTVFGKLWRVFGLMIMITMIVTAIGLYGYKHDAKERRVEIAELRAAIDHEREQIKIAEARWTVLNDPGRIQTLAERFLEMAPISPDQTVRLKDIPLRPEPPKPASITDLIDAHLPVAENGDPASDN